MHNYFLSGVDQFKLFFGTFYLLAFLHLLCCSATLWRFEVLLDETLPAKTGSKKTMFEESK